MAQGTKRKNWDVLRTKLEETKQSESVAPSRASKKRRRHTELSDALKSMNNEADSSGQSTEVVVPGQELPIETKSKYVALDCEMVGIGSSGKQSALARCCVVDFDGNKIYDRFVRPKSFVTDFRTKWSGVRKSDLREAVSLEECMADVAKLLAGKVLVGHALHNDLDVLMLSHPRSKIRDTATYKPLMRPHGRKGGKFRPRALRDLSRQFLKKTIQEGEHDPGIDAATAMMIYRIKRDEWEKSLRQASKLKREKKMAPQKSLPEDAEVGVTQESQIE